MATEVLLQILIGISIIAIIVLIAVLWKLFLVLGDIRKSTLLIKQRISDLDALVGKFEKTAAEGLAAFKTFIHSFDFIKTIKEKIENYKKGEKDGE